MKTLQAHWRLILSLALTGILAIVALTALADPPVLKITSLGTNQFLITVTNGLSTTNYTVYWTPALANTNYPWQVMGFGDVGITNFLVDMQDSPVGFFRVLIGIDQDGDGVPEWQDAQPLDPAVGVLSITIDSPTNGAVLQ